MSDVSQQNRFAPLLHFVNANAWLLAPFAVGLFLRFARVHLQVLGDDELHVLRISLFRSLSWILTNQGEADYGPPLAIFYRMINHLGVPLSEMVLRLPMLLSGSILLLVVPKVLDKRIGRETALILAWLMAVSPVLVLYSQIVRTYMPVMFLGFCAVMAFYSWLESGAARHWIAYSTLAAVAISFHLLVAPFVLSPFLYVGLERFLRPSEKGPGIASVMLVAVVTGAMIACFLIPQWESFVHLAEERAWIDFPKLRTWKGVAMLQAGTGRAVLVVFFWSAFVYGLFSAIKRFTRFGCFLVTLVAGHLCGILLLSPNLVELPLVLNRYLLISFPFILILVSEGLVAPWRSGQQYGRSVIQRFAAYVFILVLIFTGPFGDANFRSSSFTHHNDLMKFYHSPLSMNRQDVPAFYYRLAEEPNTGPVLEYPWAMSWGACNIFYIYQNIHRHEVLVSTPPTLDPINRVDGTRLKLRNQIRGWPQFFLESRARYLIIHINPKSEENRVLSRVLISARKKPARVDWDLLRATGGTMGERLKKEWGPPIFEDRSILAWDLNAVREKFWGSKE